MGIYEISLATMVCINIILAVGLNMITGFCGQISLGHAAFYGIGAYTAALMAKAGVPLPVSLLAGLILAGIVGVIVGLTSLRVREDFLAITTMGVGFLFVGIVRQQEVLGGELGISSIPSHGLGKLGFLALVILLAALIAAFSLYIKRSWMGFAFDAVADDEDSARVLSVDVASYKLAAFARAQEWDERIPIGLIYKKERPVYEEQLPALKTMPLVKQKIDVLQFEELLKEFI